MSLSGNKQWQEDIDKVLSDLDLSRLSDCRIMVTGCTGLICSAVVDALIRWNTCHDEKIVIYAVSRSVDDVRERFKPYSRESWFETGRYDATQTIDDLRTDCDYIINGAGNASPDKIIHEPVETMWSNINGLKNLLDYLKNNKAKRLLYISSSEVYGRSDKTEPFSISDYGYIDILNPRTSYSSAKRAAETLCVSYSFEYRVDSVIVRPGHVYGPTAKKSDNRVSSAWAYAAASGLDIVMKSDGSQIRSYCYAADAASAILKVLLNGKTAQAYNISNPNSIISIKEIAEMMTQAAGVIIKYDFPDEMEKKGFNPMLNSSLDAKQLMELGWKAKFGAKEGIEHTVWILRDLKDE